MRRSVTAWCALVAALSAPAVSAQQVFHSVQSANLQTAEILPRGSWLFEISHRFSTPVAQGADELWGLDGPAFIRLGLAYSAHDRVQIGVQRSNLDDNTELNAKIGLWSGGPLKVAAMGGVAWNTDVTVAAGAEDNESQIYGQLIVNALLGERVALAIVPGYLNNQRLRDFDKHGAFVLGAHGQVYLTPSMSLLGEWLMTTERPNLAFDPLTFGVEFETRGHFFKLVVTNLSGINTTQVLRGAGVRFEGDQLRLGFNITRLLPF